MKLPSAYTVNLGHSSFSLITLYQDHVIQNHLDLNMHATVSWSYLLSMYGWLYHQIGHLGVEKTVKGSIFVLDCTRTSKGVPDGPLTSNKAPDKPTIIFKVLNAHTDISVPLASGTPSFRDIHTLYQCRIHQWL